MTDALYQKFVKRWLEVTDLPPQALGPFTPLYKWATGKLKVMPWPTLVIVSIIVILLLYWALGSAIVFLVSLLQRGF